MLVMLHRVAVIPANVGNHRERSLVPRIRGDDSYAVETRNRTKPRE